VQIFSRSKRVGSSVNTYSPRFHSMKGESREGSPLAILRSLRAYWVAEPARENPIETPCFRVIPHAGRVHGVTKM
jgi:hypothetical protein